MNKVYRTVWNEHTNTWTAVQENAKAKGKSGSSGWHALGSTMLSGLGFKSPRFAYTVIASAMMMTAGYANAGPGIFINDGTDSGCVVTNDTSLDNNAVFFLVGNQLQWAAGRNGSNNLPSASNFQGKCLSGDAATQTNRALFYGDANLAGSKHLTLGGRLDVNSGIIGLGDRTANNNSIRIGSGSTLDAANSKLNSIAIGSDVSANANKALAIGSAAKATAEQTVALGNNAHAAVAKSVALGSGTTAVAATDQSGTKTVNGLDYTYVGDSANSSVTVGNRQIKQVGAGEVSANSTDAVNGSQLFATQKVIGNIGKGVADNLGGGAALKPDGTFTAPNYNLNDAGGNPVTKNNVGDALDVLNNRMNAGLKIDADNSAPDTVKLGETIKYAGDGNIKTTVTDNQIGFKLADNITVGPATGGNPVKIDGNAGTVTGLTNTTWNPNNITSGRGATEDQLKAAVATTPLTVTNGKVTPPAAADAGKLATAGDIANAINNSGFNINAGGNVVGTSTPTTAKPGSTLTLKAGDGLTVKQDLDGNGNQSYTYAVDAQSVVQSAQAPIAYTKADGTKVYKHTDGNFYDAPNGAGNPVPAANVITSLQNAAGSTTAPTTLANVKSNLADVPTTATTNPANNDRAALTANNKGNNAATVNDVLNAGFTVQGNGQDKDFVTHGDTINFVNGQGTVANVSTAGGVTTVKFDTPMTYADAAGNPTNTPSNKVNLVGGTAGSPVTLGNVADGNIAAGSKDAVNGGQLYATNQNVAKGINFGGTTGSNNYRLGDTINVKGDSNIYSTTIAGGAQLALNPNLNVTSVTATDAAGNQTVTNGGGVTITPAAGGNPVSLTTGGLNNGGNKITNIAAGNISATSTDAVNGSQLYQIAQHVTNNVTTSSPVQYSNSSNPTAANGGTKSNDVTLVGLNSAPVTLHNVAPGRAGTDAVNVNQLGQVAGNLNNRINKVADEADAGTAAAMAAAGLPQAYLPGKSMVAVSGSTYRGKQGYAVGMSAITDGGNWIIKGIATGNSEGHFGATIGAGYQW